ncbi:MAG: amino acid permease [Acidobacteriaceae bacterium]
MTTKPAPLAQMPAGESHDPQFVKGLGLMSATTLVIGCMIGSGIFIVSADIARLVGSPALLIAAWLVTGVMTIAGALSYAELAAMMPTAGGQYIYLREAMSPMWGFLYGWTYFLVIGCGTIAAVGVAFGKFLGVLVPWVSGTRWIWHMGHIGVLKAGPVSFGNMDVGLNTANLIAILVIVLLTAINITGVKTGAMVQNIFTIAKTAALLGIVVLGFTIGRNHAAIAANFGNFWQNVHWSSLFAVQSPGGTAMVGILTIVGVAQVGSLFSADAWYVVSFTAGEVRNPQRNLPLSLALGTGTVILLYVLANFAYLMVLPLHGAANAATIIGHGIQFAPEDRVATEFMQTIFPGVGAALMAFAIMISTFGCDNGLILGGARLYYAMAKDGLFFKSASKLHPKYRTPAAALIMQGIWCCLLCLSGTYSQLLDYIIFASVLFYIFSILAVFILRFKRPDAPRPYRAIGYPVVPGLYLVMAIFVDVVLLRYKPQYTWPGLILVILGIPVYMLWSRTARAKARLAT